MLDRIHLDPHMCEGKPTVRGLRITVDSVLALLGNGYDAEDIVREYPDLEKEDADVLPASAPRPAPPACRPAPGQAPGAARFLAR